MTLIDVSRSAESFTDADSTQSPSLRVQGTPLQSAVEMRYVEEDSLGYYLKAIGDVPLLTKEEEIKLAQLIDRGKVAASTLAAIEDPHDNPSVADLATQVSAGSKARERFIVSNLRLVISFVKRTSIPSGLDRLDLIQAGNIGLEAAVDKFDWRKGYKFSTYAKWLIKNEIDREVTKHGGIVSIPHDQYVQARARSKALANTPKASETQQLDPEEEKILRSIGYTSLDAPTVDGAETTRGDFLIDPRQTSPEYQALSITTLHNELMPYLNNLPPLEREIMYLHYGLVDGTSYTLVEINQRLGLEKRGAQKLHARSLRSIRENLPQSWVTDQSQRTYRQQR